MPLDYIVSHFILFILTCVAITYPVHQKYPFEKGKQLTAEQRFSLEWRVFIYVSMMLGISALMTFPVVYREVIQDG